MKMIVIKFLLIAAALWNASHFASSTDELKTVIAKKLKQRYEEIKIFKQEHGSTKISDITIDMVYSGMRGINALVTETSSLDAEEGIRFRGYSIPQCLEMLPKAPGGNEPLPEGLFWLLITGDIPTPEQVKWVSKTWAERATLPPHVVTMLSNLPETIHPMTQLVSAVALLNSESTFSQAYAQGIPKSEYWEYAYEDSMNLIAKLPVIAATIYRNVYHRGEHVEETIDKERDWSANFATLLGINKSDGFVELLRMYLFIHSDHEGGNVSAHTTHLVGSALADPYLSYSAGMAGLAGPLHGLATQEVLVWLQKLQGEFGDSVTNDQVKEFILKTLESGQVIPGYGHAVLRKTDPRYTCQREFALKHLPEDPLFKLVSQVYDVAQVVLKTISKIKNPWPNVDAHSGVLLNYYGLKEMNFYTVLFGVSRALGVLASLVWDRGLGLPIERPKSLSTDELKKLVTDAEQSPEKSSP